MASDNENAGVAEFYAAWASGRPSEAFGYAAGVATSAAGQTAADLYELHVMADHANAYAERVRRVKDWGYTRAAEYVSRQRHQGRIHGYRLDWGHQAARDGLCEALWGHVRGTGLAERAKRFGIGERPYQRVRDYVREAAKGAMNDFEGELGAAIRLDLAG